MGEGTVPTSVLGTACLYETATFLYPFTHFRYQSVGNEVNQAANCEEGEARGLG
jgi:hypothetical protein